MTTVKCSFCGKELSKQEAAVVWKGTKPVYYCQEHKGFKTPQQFFWSLVIDVMDEPRLTKTITNKVHPLIKQYGPEKISALLYDKKKEYQELFRKKEKDFFSHDHKVSYFCGIVKREAPGFKTNKKEKIDMRNYQDVYEPMYDKNLTTQSSHNYRSRETSAEKRIKLLQKMESDDIPVQEDPFRYFNRNLTDD